MSAITHLYESAHCFDETSKQLSAVNLIPQEWNRITVTDGKAMSEDTLSALKWRDVYLANTIEGVSGELEDKYIGGKGIKIDKSTHTISRCDCKGDFIFTSGLAYNEEFGNLIYPVLDESETNRLIINESNQFAYNGPHETETIFSADGFYDGWLTSGSDKFTAFPAGCNLVYVSQPYSSINYEAHGGDPTERPNGTTTTYEDFDPLSGADEIGNNFYAYSGESYKVYYWHEEQSQAIPENGYDVLTEAQCVKTTSEGAVNFDPSNQTEIKWVDYHETPVFTAGPNYIKDGVNMAPTGVLYIWD